jgi:hypothetical protein
MDVIELLRGVHGCDVMLFSSVYSEIGIAVTQRRFTMRDGSTKEGSDIVVMEDTMCWYRATA